MNVHPTLHEFAGRYGDLTRKRFLDQFSRPMLLVEMKPRKTPEGWIAFAKTSDARAPTEAPVRLSQSYEETYVVSLEKSDRNEFEGMITLGRDGNNDVVLPHRSVSKYHAVFRREGESGRMTVADVGSRNGTALRGRFLEEGVPLDLEDGSEIVLGKSIKATYLEPESFFEHLKVVARLTEETDR